MRILNSLKFKKSTLFVLLFSLLLSVLLTISAWDINFWPTDTKAYYFDAAVNLPNYDYLSQMHDSLDAERIKWLHGKEIFVLSASIMQRVINDIETLRPFILVCIFSVFFSSILVFLIARSFWGKSVGLLCFVFFVTSFWPYLYVLFAKHQPLGLFFFLFAFYLVQNRFSGVIRYFFVFLSGLCMCLSFFSSTVSALYFPYYFIGYFWILYSRTGNEYKIRGFLNKIICEGFVFFVGFLCVFIYVNYPNILYNVQSFLDYVRISGEYNHFYYNQPVLQQWVSGDVASVRGGWLWVVKYFFLIMPIVFPLYLLAVVFLLIKCFKNKENRLRNSLIIISMVILSWSSPLLAEIKGVAQYGANYFSSFIGLVFLIGYAAHEFFNKKENNYYVKWYKKVIYCIAVLGVLHVVINARIFLSDIYPTRMATTFLSKEIKKLGLSKLHTYSKHPHRANMVDCLNPEVQKKMEWLPMGNIVDPKDGVILLPPITGESIYYPAHSDYSDYDRDVYLNTMFKKGSIEKYSLASFKTMAASRIWSQEEEILSYRYLALNQFPKNNEAKGSVWLLDAKKIFNDKKQLFPDGDDLNLVKNNIRNIGTDKRVLMYKGYWFKTKNKISAKGLATRIYKVGNPNDGLVCYIYKVDKKQPVWIPFDENFKSHVVSAEEITNDGKGGLVLFPFKSNLELNAGMYKFIIYRTGDDNPAHYYRIYANNHVVVKN